MNPDDAKPDVWNKKKVRASAEGFINAQREMVDERRHLLDRVHRLMPEHATHMRGGPDTLGPVNEARDVGPTTPSRDLQPGAPDGRHLDPAETRMSDLDAPESDAHKRENAPPEIPRDKHGVPDFQTPEAPEVPVDKHGVPEFRLREAPAPIRDEPEKGEDAASEE